MTRLARKMIRNTKKSTFARPAAANDMPPKPRKHATREISRNTSDEYNITNLLQISALSDSRRRRVAARKSFTKRYSFREDPQPDEALYPKNRTLS